MIAVRNGAELWNVVVRLKPDHAHHVCIERDGLLLAEHVGSLPETWPTEAFPDAVYDAVEQIREQMSWS